MYRETKQKIQWKCRGNKEREKIEANEENTIFSLGFCFLLIFVWSFNLIMMHIWKPTKWLETLELYAVCARAFLLLLCFVFFFANGMLDNKVNTKQNNNSSSRVQKIKQKANRLF
jgi:hypothetical protein